MMYKRILQPIILLSVGWLILFTGCTRLHQQKKHQIEVPKGWVYSPNNAFVKYVHAKESKPEYELVISRPTSKEQLYYVSIAESIFPDLSRYQDIVSKGKASAANIKKWYFERLWWSDEYEGYKIPYSITSDCINYYIAKYADRKKEIKNTKKNTDWRGSIEKRIKLHYKATVENTTDNLSYKKIKLELQWYYFCGQTCGWGFSKTRELIFSSTKKIERIIGDTPIEVWEASEEKPYAPDQWITF